MFKRFISLSQYPSKHGHIIYNAFFKHYGIEASYTPIGTNNLKEQIELAKKQGINGISISMPFKQEVIQYLDHNEPLVSRYNLCNTILNDNGLLKGHNCDYFGALHAIDQLSPYQTVTLLGAGAMGSMFKSMLDTRRFDVLQFSPRLKNWKHRHQLTQVIINCTNRGTTSKASPLRYIPKSVKVIVDVSLQLGTLFKQAQNNRCKYITGQEIYKYQFLQQFKVYTDISITENDYDRITNELKI